MTDCPNADIRDLLPDLLHGRLAADEREAVQTHLRGCAECRAELALLGDMRRAMHRTPSIATADIVRALPAYRAPARRTRAAWRVAAAAALLAGGGTTLIIARQAPLSSGDGARVAVAPVIRSTTSPASMAPGAVGTSPSVDPTLAAAGASTKELAVATTSVSDLNEEELNALVNEIGSLDAVTPVDVDHAAPVSPIAPSQMAPSGAGA